MADSTLPPHLRAFDDPVATRKLIYDNVLDAVTKRFPIENDSFRLELSDPHYEGSQDYTLRQQKDALLKNRKLQTNLVGTWKLIDKSTNKVLEERKDSIMQVPFYTNRGTIISNGNDYTVISQSRLKPGVYSRRQKNGEIETHFNIKPGTGRGFHFNMEPSTGVFRFTIGQAHVPLYPLLKGMGVTDKEIMKYWGPDVTAANAKKSDPTAVRKLYERLAGYRADPTANDTTRGNFIREKLEASYVDPYVVERTMGLRNVTGVTPELMLRASQKMLNISRGEENSDNRDSPRYSDIYSIEDFLKERVEKDAGRLSKSLIWRASRDKSLKYIPRNALNPYLDSFLSGSRLAMPGEEANPLSILEQQTRITKLGEGGISSSESVTDEARAVQGDYFGFVDPIQGPEGTNIGVDVRASYNTYKGKDNKLYGEFVNAKTGKTEFLDISTASDRNIAFPGEDLTKPYVYIMKDNVPKKCKSSDVDYVLPSFAHMFGSNTNMNPFPTAVQGPRQFYGSKFWSQYLPQKQGEIPLVDSLMPDGKTTFSEYYGKKVGTLSSGVDGTVVKITDDLITIKDNTGKKHEVDLVKNLPFNRLSAISYYPAVEIGQTVKAGDMVAHSNFTDKKTGAINIGQNLKVAILPYEGKSFEDAHVISESAARKLSTERLYGFEQEEENEAVIDRKKYMAAFPKKFTREQFDTIDDNGAVKVGTVLHKGDPIIVSLGPKTLNASDAALGKLSKVLRNAYTDRSETWEHDWPGTVVDVAKTSKGMRVNVVTTPPVNVADKLSGRFGLKGVVGTIVPDSEMPRDAVTNEPYDMLINPMGFLSRVAPGQIMEIALGKVAKQTGRQIRIPQLPPQEGWYSWCKKQLEDNHVTEAADIFDPKTGKTIKNIGDGYMFVSAFHHLAEKKASARGSDSAYTQDEMPARGGEDGSKRFSSFDVQACLAHGATALIKDAITIRGTKNEEYWNSLRLGLPLKEPGTPFVYSKFLNTLRAGGINVVDKGSTVSIMPMTDKDIDALSNGREIKSSQTVDAELKPVLGGLFDIGKTGGAAGNRWSYIQLPEPVPSPLMEEPVRRVLGLTTAKLESVLSGNEKLGEKTGGEAIKDALASINVDKMIEKCREDIHSKRGSNRDNAIKVLGYLKSMKDQGLSPTDWMITKVPVLPPVFRPISKAGSVMLVSDMNELYKDVIENSKNFTELHKDLPDSDTTEERLNIYKSVKAAFGLGEAVNPEGQAKNIKGAIRQVIGTTPKFGMAQSKVFSKTVDTVGRGAITPDPNLDMDQIGISEDLAWTMYKPFVMRAMVRRGYSPVQTLQMIDDRNKTARSFLDEEMQNRPVLMDRAPTWHKFNLMAFTPHISEGKTVRVCPLVVSGFNADFDGDTVNIHVPVSEKAVKQAKEKMMPSKNLIQTTDLRSTRHSLGKEMIFGVYKMTEAPSMKPPVRFASMEDAKKAYREGKIGINDPIIFA